MKNRIYIIGLLLIVVAVFGRQQDMPHFGSERVLFPLEAGRGNLTVGGGYAPYYIDRDSSMVTAYGNFQLGITNWLSVEGYLPYFSEIRTGLLKAGLSDAVVGVSARWKFPLLSMFRGALFYQVSLPTGYTGEHELFPSYTSGANDMCYGAAFGFETHDRVYVTANFSATMPENPSTRDEMIILHPSGGVMLRLPWQVDIGVTYFTDLSPNPAHDVEITLAKQYKFAKLKAGFGKDFNKSDMSYYYRVQLETIIPLFSTPEPIKRNVEVVDRTDWNKFPGVDTLWKTLMVENRETVNDADSSLRLEVKLIDYLTRTEKKTYVPFLFGMEHVKSKYTLKLTAFNEEGNIVLEKSVFGEDKNKSHFLLLDDRPYDKILYNDVSEENRAKRNALMNLHNNLVKETNKIREGKF